MKLPVALFSVVLLASPAFAQTSGGITSGSGAVIEDGSREAAEGASSSSENEDSERRICRRVEALTSSRIGTRRVCLTAREWRDFNRGN